MSTFATFIALTPRADAAPSVARAVDLIRPAEPAAPISWAMALLCLLFAGVLVAVAVFVWRRAEPEEPAEEAFRRLARAFRLRRRDREMIRRLAATRAVPGPAALLLSEHAYRVAMESLWSSTDDPALRAHAGRLLNHLHGDA